uniref:Uncharacterized protein n=1 Tax=Rhizophora mucronata TaxID=61149 RepID=A0A2P2MU58_RHIMU
MPLSDTVYMHDEIRNSSLPMNGSTHVEYHIEVNQQKIQFRNRQRTYITN